MTLQEKVLRLKLEAVAAVRHALWWEKQIQIHGEEKATAFYKHLGLNHVEDKESVHIFLHGENGPAFHDHGKKSFEWDGLTLSREPTEAEMRCVKGIAGAQETAKEKVTRLLVELRAEMITVGIDQLQLLTPATYHTLILTPSEQARLELRERLSEIYKQGRSLVAAELRRQGKQFEDEEEELDQEELDYIADLTNGRVANDVQARITGAVARLALLGLSGAALLVAVRREMADGSTAYIERASQATTNKVINLGRYREGLQRRSDWERVEYSALLDSNVCEPCASEDGQESRDGSDLEPVPNVNCPGECRCFWVYIQTDG